jgi:hypothetical protein
MMLCHQPVMVRPRIDKRAQSRPRRGAHRFPGGLLEWQVTDISFEVDINQTQVVTTLAITGPNEVQCVIDLPKVSGKAWLDTYPGPAYWIVLAADAVSCFWLGAGCGLLTEAIEVGVFLALNIAYLSVDLGSPHIAVDASLQPDQSQIMWPTPAVTVTANASVTVLNAMPPNVGTIVGPCGAGGASNRSQPSPPRLGLGRTCRIRAETGWTLD